MLAPGDVCLDNVVGDSVDDVVDEVVAAIDKVEDDCWYLHEGPKYLGSSSGGMNKVQISPVGHEVKVVTSTLQRTNFSEALNGLERDKNQ